MSGGRLLTTGGVEGGAGEVVQRWGQLLPAGGGSDGFVTAPVLETTAGRGGGRGGGLNG